MQPAIEIKRAYEPASPEDGSRILVDRYWPRGVRKEAARIDAWLKDLAPSRELIAWFGHRPERWDEFRRRYHQELTWPEAEAALRDLQKRAAAGKITLVYSAWDEAHNNAVALKQILSST